MKLILGSIPFLILVVIVLYELAIGDDDHDKMVIFLGFTFIVMAIIGLIFAIT